MSDLIRREEVIEALKLLRDDDDPYDEGYNLGLNTAILEVKKRIPTAEPKVGRWIMHIDDLFPADSTQECSICHEHQYILNDDNYCPNCGSRMMERRTDE